MSDMREAFERTVRATWSDSYIFTRDTDGHYCDDVLDGMWWAWQAARAQGDVELVAWWDGDTGEPETAFQFERDNIYEIPVFTRPPKAQAVPEGWKLVPIASTSEMDIAAHDRGIMGVSRDEAEIIWNVMIDAAPQPPKQEGDQ